MAKFDSKNSENRSSRGGHASPNRLSIFFALWGLLWVQGCTERQVAQVEVSSVAVAPSTVTLVAGGEVSLVATLTDDGGEPLTGVSFDWSSEDPTVATVDQDGNVLGVSEGSTVVHATFGDQSGSSTVDVVSGPGIEVSQSSVSFFAGAGGPSPDPETLFVTNLGTGVLSGLSVDVQHASAGASWLTAELSATSAPASITLAASAEGLPAGVSSATLVISSSLPDVPIVEVPVTLTVTGFSVRESDGTTVVSESGTSDAATVVLQAQPESDVVLDVSSSDRGEATVSPSALTFTPEDWDVPQTITITGVDDDEADGDETSLVTISVNADASDDAYDNFPDHVIDVTTTDDEGAGLALVESGGSTVVDEAGGTDDFTVALTARPMTTVVLGIASDDPGEAAVTPSTLTFTPENWNAPQTVTVTGVDDAATDGDQTSTVTVSVDGDASDDAYAGVGDLTVSVTTADDDGAGFVLAESGGSTVVDEGGSTDDFTVVLTAQPATDVVLTVKSDDTGEATAAPSTVTFTSGNWDVAQTVTVTGVDDEATDGDQVSTVTVAVDDAASDDAYDAAGSQSVSVTTTDDDAAGLTLAVSGSGTLVTEAGGTDGFTVVLTAQPATDVVLTVTSEDTGEATVSPSTLTFTSGDWDVAQTVTVTGVDDLIDDGDQETVITVSVDDGASDDAYDAVADRTIAVTTTDDDAGAGLTITEIGGTTVSEGGSTDDFTVVLTAQPATDVVLTVTSEDTGEATVSPSTLTFTSGDWDVAQTVTVTGVDDLIDDGDQETVITVSVDDGASDDAYDGVADRTIAVTTTDDDEADLDVVESGGSTVVDEGGSTDDFTVVLTAQPATDVVLTVTSEDTGEATVSPSTLTFTSGDWDVAQTVTVTGMDDDETDGDQVSAVTVAVDGAASDGAYDGLPSRTVSVTTTDDDEAGLDVVENGGSTVVDEGGSTDDFTVVLTAQPATDVVLTVTSEDTGEATVSPSTLTFTSGDWDVAQTVTVTGVDDLTDDGDQVTTVTVAVDGAASDDAYGGVSSRTVSVTTTDDDEAGLDVVESGGSTVVDEGGSTDDFTVVLTAQPANDVVLTVTSEDTGEATVSLSTLTFTSGDWNVAQTVTVTGVDDLTDDGDQVTTVTVAVDGAASDDAYDGVPSRTVSVTTTDDDEAGLDVVESGGSTVVHGAVGGVHEADEREPAGQSEGDLGVDERHHPSSAGSALM